MGNPWLVPNCRLPAGKLHFQQFSPQIVRRGDTLCHFCEERGFISFRQVSTPAVMKKLKQSLNSLNWFQVPTEPSLNRPSPDQLVYNLEERGSRRGMRNWSTESPSTRFDPGSTAPIRDVVRPGFRAHNLINSTRSISTSSTSSSLTDQSQIFQSRMPARQPATALPHPSAISTVQKVWGAPTPSRQPYAATATSSLPTIFSATNLSSSAQGGPQRRLSPESDAESNATTLPVEREQTPHAGGYRYR